MRSLVLVLLLAFQISFSKEIPAQFTAPMAKFIENRGQIIGTDKKPVPEVKFYSGTIGSTQAFFTPTRVSYVFPKIEITPKVHSLNFVKELTRNDSMPQITALYRMDVEFVGANSNAQIIGGEQSSEYTNYYFAHCSQGITYVPSFEKLTVKDVYPHIDAVWKTSEHGLKYEFVIRPGGDYHQIKIRYSGANTFLTSEQITASTPFGSLRDESPVSYQNGIVVQTQFRQIGKDYGFSVAQYDKSQTLILDPMVVWGVYQNEVLSEYGLLGMKVDPGGNVIIAGLAQTSIFPTTSGAIQPIYSGNGDSYIAKFDKDGVRKWGTYYGGSGSEPILFGDLYTNCLALDGNSNIVFVGSTSSPDFPLQNATQNVYGGGIDMFIVKLFSNGTREWATYYGGSDIDVALGATIDPPLGKVVAVGYSESLNFPTTASVFQPANPLGGGTGVVVKLNPDGARQWATFCGDIANSANSDYLAAVTTDNSGNIYTTGCTTGSFPTTIGTYQPINPSFGSKITVTKLDPNGQRAWATFHGRGVGNDIICDNSTLYVVGTSGFQGTFDVTAGFPNAVKGAADVCIFTLENSTGNRNTTSWSRLFGGTGQAGSWQYGSIDYGMNIAFDAGGNIWVGGLAAACSDFPVTVNTAVPSWAYNIQQTYKGGNTDGFFAQFDKTNGNVLYSSLFGSISQDYGGYALPFGSSNVYYGINSFNDGNATTFPVPSNRRIGAPYSITIAKICTTNGINTNAGSNAVLCSGDTLQIGATPVAGISYTWNTRTTLSDSTIANPKAFPKNTGTTTTTIKYNVLATDAAGCFGADTVVLTVKPGPSVTSRIEQPRCVGSIGAYSLTGMYSSVKPDDKFSWEARGGVINGDTTQQTVSVLWTKVGIDTVYMTVTNGVGCSARARLLVEVSPLPIVDAGPDLEICEDSTVVLLASVSGGIGNLSCSWTPTTDIISSSTIVNPTIKPSKPITDYTLTVTDSRGCIRRDTLRVIMNPKPIVFAGKDTAICLGESVQLVASVRGGTPQYTVNWMPSIGLSATNILNPIATTTTSRNYICQITDAKGCRSQDTVFIQVTVKPILRLLPDSLDFGQLDGCISSLEKTVSINNSSASIVRLTGATSDNISFVVSSGFPVLIGANQRKDITIKFSPVTAGKSNGTILLEGTPCGIILSLKLEGEKISLPVKSSPAAVDFGQSNSCTNRITDTSITITNTGTEALLLVQPIVQLPYSIISPVFPFSVKIGDSIKIIVRYSPTTDGNFAQAISFPYSEGICRDTIKISMNGTSFSQTIAVSPSQMQFPLISGCETFRDTVIIIENTSIADIRVDSAIGGGVFKILSPSLPIVLKSGEKHQVGVRFLPRNSGSITDSVQFAFSPCIKKIAARFSGEKQGTNFAVQDTLDAGEIISCLKKTTTVKLTIENTSSNGIDGRVESVTIGNSLITTLGSGAILAPKLPLEFDVMITPPNDGKFIDSITVVLNPCGISKTIYVKCRRTSIAFTADISNINIGKIQIGTNRAMPVNFTNTGSTPLTITSVPNLAPPFSIISIVPPLPAVLQPSEKLTITVNYLGTDGLQTSKIFALATFPCSVFDSVLVDGEGTASPQPLLLVTNQLNFDSICIGDEKLLIAQVTNNGGVPLQVQQAVISGNTGDFSVKNFVPSMLLPTETMSVQIGCSPLALGQRAARIVWITDLVRDSTDILGIGNGCSNRDSTVIKIADMEAETGDKIRIALLLEKESGLAQSGATKFSAKVRFNRTIVHLTDPTFVCLSSPNPNLCEVELLGDYQIGRDTIVFLRAEATLGEADSTKLELIDFQWLNGKIPVKIIRQDGELRLTNICREGGTRLYKPTQNVSLSVFPNPSNDNAEIEYILREESSIKVALMDILGREVMVIDNSKRNAGAYKRIIDLRDTGEGIYFLMLQCPNVVKTVRMTVVK
jgi:hypothetical protein